MCYWYSNIFSTGLSMQCDHRCQYKYFFSKLKFVPRRRLFVISLSFKCVLPYFLWLNDPVSSLRCVWGDADTILGGLVVPQATEGWCCTVLNILPESCNEFNKIAQKKKFAYKILNNQKNTSNFPLRALKMSANKLDPPPHT